MTLWQIHPVQFDYCTVINFWVLLGIHDPQKLPVWGTNTFDIVLHNVYETNVID